MKLWGLEMLDILIAVILDYLIGDPAYSLHPVRLMGKLINAEEKLIRQKTSSPIGLKTSGFVVVVFNLLIGFFIPYYLLKIASNFPLIYRLANIYLIYSAIAGRCLSDEAKKIYEALNRSLEEARYRLSFIVGRDTLNLNEQEILRATVETVAENTSDGVVAPLFYIMLFGAPLGIVYKFVNTMDSMLGYKNEKYRDLGFFPAKTDDVFNFIPARLTGILMCISSIGKYDVKRGIKIMFRDRKNHKSPNCAYPEGAVAGLLGIQLGGSNFYNGELIVKPTIGDYDRPISKEDIFSTIDILYRTLGLHLILYYFLKLSL
jgi:adenosylcobinamide-phosphate synthase